MTSPFRLAALLSLPFALPLSAVAASLELRIDGPTRVGAYDKIEFRIATGKTWSRPFDPDVVDVSLELTSPSGKRIEYPAFYIQPYGMDAAGAGTPPAGWVYPAAPAGFRARFAPPEPGAWTARARLKETAGALASKPVRFTCVPSKRKGPIRVSARDPRFFAFPDGTPFFPVGQNVAFVGHGQYVKPAKAEAVFRKLADHGANYVRVWVCCHDWATAIEARKSAWGRSWSWKPPIVPAPGLEGKDPPASCVKVAGGASVHVNPSHPVALKPGAPYRLAGRVRTEGGAALEVHLGGIPLGDPVRSAGAWIAFERPFTAAGSQWRLPRLELRATGGGAAFVRRLSLREQAGGTELLWEAGIDRPVRGHFNQPDCAVVDGLVEAAERTGLYLQLTLLTRDLYMKTLSDPERPEYARAVADAKRVLRYAVARWGWSTHVACWEYFNEMDPGKPADEAYRAWGGYLERIDPFRRLRATSDWGPNPRQWAHPQLDVADLHWYLRPTWGALSKDAAGAVLDRAKLLRGKVPTKAALLGEFGLADDKWGLSPYMKQDTEGIHIHNALWASALSGLSGTALFWWWDQIDRMDLYAPYRGVSAFVADIPFTTAGLERASGKVDGADCRVVGLRGKDRAYLWIQSLQSTWWKAVVGKAKAPEVKGATVTVEGLAPGTYRVAWWDTRTGQVVKEKSVRAAGAELKLAVPAFTRDVACKVVPKG